MSSATYTAFGVCAVSSLASAGPGCLQGRPIGTNWNIVRTLESVTTESGSYLIAGGIQFLLNDPHSLVAQWDESTWSADFPPEIKSNGARSISWNRNTASPRLFFSNNALIAFENTASTILVDDPNYLDAFGAADVLPPNLTGQLYFPLQLPNSTQIATFTPVDVEYVGAPFQGAVCDIISDEVNGQQVLYAAGSFYAAGATACRNVAMWDGQAWQPLGAGLNNQVCALAIFEDQHGRHLIAGGAFTRSGGKDVVGLARWDGSEWHPFEYTNQPEIQWSFVRNMMTISTEQGPMLAVAGDGTGLDLWFGIWTGHEWIQPESSGWTGGTFSFEQHTRSDGVTRLYTGGTYGLGNGAFTNVIEWEIGRTDCDADIDENCTVNFFDIGLFLQSFASGAPLADWNDDGVYNFFDVGGFLESYLSNPCN